ncbi:MAG: hypothetical protein KDA91_25005 [Planctomycetaceae bacterium]|nr:hypothetical protein [Planctomycetaceae bacterium]
MEVRLLLTGTTDSPDDAVDPSLETICIEEMSSCDEAQCVVQNEPFQVADPTTDPITAAIESSTTVAVFDEDDPTNFEAVVEPFSNQYGFDSWDDFIQHLADHYCANGPIDRLLIVDHGLTITTPIQILGITIANVDAGIGSVPQMGTEAILDPARFAEIEEFLREDARIIFAACNLGLNEDYCQTVFEVTGAEVVASTGTNVIFNDEADIPDDAVINLFSEDEWRVFPMESDDSVDSSE